MTVPRSARLFLLALLAAWFVVPLVPLLLWAVAESWAAGAALPLAWGAGNFAQVLTGDGADAFLRSLTLGVLVAALATPAGALAARALTLRRVHAPRVVAALLFAPVALPVFAIVMGLDVVLLRLRVPASLGILLVLVVVALPYTTYLMRVAYAGYDFAFEDEARTLGASRRSVLWRVRLPLLSPALAGATLLAFLVGWSDYIVTLLIGGGRFVTVPVLVGSAAAGTGNEPTVAALSVAALVPPALLVVAVIVLRRRLRPRTTSPTPVLEGAA
jgi:putative spermidine/putrescine transport system permease protein